MVSKSVFTLQFTEEYMAFSPIAVGQCKQKDFNFGGLLPWLRALALLGADRERELSPSA